jgi:transposase-like protein
MTTTDRGRFSAKRKREAVLRLLRGETLDALSRELGVTAATLADWRERFLTAGEAGLKSRDGDGRDLELARLRRKVGELTMDNEVLQEAVRRHQGTAPLGGSRSKP